MALFLIWSSVQASDGHLTNLLPIRRTDALVDGESRILTQLGRAMTSQTTFVGNDEKRDRYGNFNSQTR
jgi:hypothetical protein